MKNVKIELLGRFAALILFALFFECCLTFGACLEIEEYNAMGWVIQVMIIILCLWGTITWYDNDNKPSPPYNL